MISSIDLSEVHNREKEDRAYLVLAVLAGVYCALMVAFPAMADDTNQIVTGITSGTEAIWKIIVGISGPVAAIALALQVIKIVWGGVRAAEEARSTTIKIIIAIAVVLMAPAIVSIIQGWFQQSEWKFKY